MLTPNQEHQISNTDPFQFSFSDLNPCELALVHVGVLILLPIFTIAAIGVKTIQRAYNFIIKNPTK